MEIQIILQDMFGDIVQEHGIIQWLYQIRGVIMQKYKKSIIHIILFLIAILIILIVIICIYSSRAKNFKATIRQAEEVRIMSGNTGESILITKKDIEKLANIIEETDFKLVLFPKQYEGWSYSISYTINDMDWKMWFGGGHTYIVYNDDTKSYQYNRDLADYIGTMYKELGGK